MSRIVSSNSESAQLWGPMMATAVLATVPPLLIYVFFQKQIISTFVTSGMKGYWPSLGLLRHRTVSSRALGCLGECSIWMLPATLVAGRLEEATCENPT